MTLDSSILRELAVGIDPSGYLRILDARYRAAPMGMGFGRARFSSQSDSFALLYAAQDLATALAERIVRDRFQGKTKRVLLESDVDDLVVASLSARSPLKLLDLRTSGATRLGIPTDAARGRSQLAGRRFSQELYDDTDFDGIIYMSRITNAECVAVYDRAVTTTLDPACPVVELLRLADLVPALKSLSIELRR